MQVINEESAGGHIGKALGGGIQKSLESLAMHSLQQLQQRKGMSNVASGLSALNFLNPEQVQQLSHLSQNPEILKNTLSLLQNESGRSKIQDLLGGLGVDKNAAYASGPVQTALVKEKISAPRRQAAAQIYGQLLNANQGQRSGAQSGSVPGSNIDYSQIAKALPYLDENQQLRLIDSLNREQQRGFQNYLAQQRLEQGERGLGLREQQLALGQSEKEQARALKLAEPFLATMRERVDIAEKSLPIVERIDALNKSGDLNTGLFGFGPAIKSEASREYESLLAALPDSPKNKQLKEAADPGLNKSAKTRQQLIDRMLSDYRKDLATGQAINSIISDEGGVPLNIEQTAKARAKEIQSGTYRPKAQRREEEYDEVANAPYFQVEDNSGNMPTIEPNDVAEQLSAQGESPIGAIAGATSPITTSKMMSANRNTQEQNNTRSESDLLGAVGRVAGRGLKGAAEGITGLAALPFNAANLVSGGKVPVPKSIQGLENLPKSVVGEKLKPQSKTEEAIGDFVEDVASFLSPGSILGKASTLGKILGRGSSWIDKAAKFFKISPAAAAKSAAVGNTAKWLLSEAGATKNEATAAKMGSMLALPFIEGRFNAGRLVNQMGSKISEQLPNTKGGYSSDLFPKARQFYNDLSNESGPAASELLNKIQDVITKKATTKDLFDLRQNLTNSKLAKGVEALPEFIREIDKTVALNVSKNPELSTAVSQLADMQAALKTTNRVWDFLHKTVSKPSNALLAGLFGYAGYASKAKGLAATAPLLLGAGEVDRVARMMLKSEGFKKAYSGVIKASLAGNAKEAQRAMTHLEKIVDKEGGK